jgi:uncharacterized membrane protein
MFPFNNKRKEFFTSEEKQGIVNAIRDAEHLTSGEVRLFVESRCRFVNAVDRAAELFFSLEMDETHQRNAVLLYVAMKDKQLAIFGDEGIHQKVGTAYWETEVGKMITRFNHDDFCLGVQEVILDIGETLKFHFPYNNDTDKNELPDDIVFGK